MPEDALAYPNELSWSYRWDARAGKMIHEKRVPPPTYALHCFVVARTARQFYQHARFEPNEPKATPPCYRYLIRLVLAQSTRRETALADRIVIPGYATLREFSADQESLLKSESGGAWQSFVQRGNWRMVFPFSRRQQQRTAQGLLASVQRDRQPLVHLVCFPSLALNHVLLLFAGETTAEGITFSGYDPNQPARTRQLWYSFAERRFYFPTTDYFAGGPVNVYEIYRGWCY